MDTNQPEAGDTLARILDAAEALLRRHGLEKLTVIDVARVLKMSHGNVYRHVSSKAALRAAVVQRWLDRVSAETAAIAKAGNPADDRLREWLRALAIIKQRKVTDDSEMLSAAAKIVRDMPEVERDHGRNLIGQVAAILQDGLQDGTLPYKHDTRATAVAILNATVRFHHPDMVSTGGAAEKQLADLDEVIDLVIRGLKVS